MSKLFTVFLVVFYTSINIIPVSFALDISYSKKSTDDSSNIQNLVYPDGADFVQLKSLIDSTFSPKQGYQYNCIVNNTLCPNYKYTNIVERAIKLIILKTYDGNEAFYDTLFKQKSSYNSTDTNTVKSVIDNVPRGSTVADWKTLGFGPSIGGQLLDASFGVNFTENANSSSMLGAIERKIQDMKRDKCKKEERSGNSYEKCPWNGDISNLYLPTPEELYMETIFLNGNSVKIEALKDEIEYSLKDDNTPKFHTLIPMSEENLNHVADYDRQLMVQPIFNYRKNGIWNFSGASVSQLSQIFPDGNIDFSIANTQLRSACEALLGSALKMDHLRTIQDFLKENGEYPSLGNIYKFKEYNDNRSPRVGFTACNDLRIDQEKIWKSLPELSIFTNELIQYSELRRTRTPPTYTIKYKKYTYTLEEAKAKILEKNIISINTISSSNTGIQLPCQSSSDSQVRKECQEAIQDFRDVSISLSAYYADRDTYPNTIEKLDKNYMPKGRGDFDKYFTYNQIVNADNSADYEIKYIGKIGQNLKSSDTVLSGSSMKRDYLALMSGSTVPEIPSIFAHIPSDSMVLYVRNPANLLDILNQKSNTSQKLSGLDVSESIRMFIRTFFEIDNFEQIEKNLKHEMAIVVNNLDATAPDIVIVLSESDKDVLSPTATARVVGSRDGLIFVASSKVSLERFTNLTIEKSLKNAPDFQYVWWKQSALIKDALVYVGDEFFANILTLETYLTHYRKYRDYARLTALQELVWAYSDAFGKSPTDFTELVGLGLSTLTGETLGEYSIEDGIVKHQNIGTLKSLRTIPEAGYNLSEISRSEIEDYKYSVLKYRDIWRSSLDPMGIVLNRYGDGLEIDFFMTPIPGLSNIDADFAELQEFVEGFTKDSLSFVTNSRIRMGLASFVWGFDISEIQKTIQNTSEIGEGFEEFSKEVLDGKNIFDYIAGEFAFSVGDIDPDMLDGWNIEKIDVYGSVQVTSEEKGKELIEIIRSRILKEVGSERGDEVEMIKGFLAKPLIEDYNGKKIYYVEGLPIPFVGKIGFAYTFVDDFFIIGLNKSTIKKVIDTTKSGDENKAKILDNSSFSSGTFFAMMVDGVTMSERIRSLYEKNKSSIPRYMKYLELADLSGDSSIDSLMGAYYSTQDRNKRLGIQTKPFSYTLGTLQINGDAEKVMVKVDAGGIKSLSGVTLQMWNNIESEPNFSKSIFSDTGIPLAEFLALPYVEDIISLNIIAHLDQITSDTESLFRNMTFGLNIGDDEIGFKFRVFREMDHPKNSNSLTGSSKDILIISLFALILGIIGGAGFVIYKRKQSQVLPSVSTYTAPIISPQPSAIVDDQPNIISSIIHTPITETPLDSNSTTIPPTGATQNQ